MLGQSETAALVRIALADGADPSTGLAPSSRAPLTGGDDVPVITGVDENTEGVNLFRVPVSDPDGLQEGQSFRTSLSAGSQHFVLSQPDADGHQWVQFLAGRADFENGENGRYELSLLIEVVDANDQAVNKVDGTPNQVEVDYLVQLNDVNEAPTGFALTALNARSGVYIGDFIGFTDPDAGDSAASYEVVQDDADSVITQSHLFRISDDGNGLDFIDGADAPDTGGRSGLGTTYDVRIRVTDSGGLTYEQIITIAEGTVSIDTAGTAGDRTDDSFSGYLDADGNGLLAENSGGFVVIGGVHGATGDILAADSADNDNSEFAVYAIAAVGATIAGSAADLSAGAAADHFIHVDASDGTLTASATAGATTIGRFVDGEAVWLNCRCHCRAGGRKRRVTCLPSLPATAIEAGHVLVYTGADSGNYEADFTTDTTDRDTLTVEFITGMTAVDPIPEIAVGNTDVTETVVPATHQIPIRVHQCGRRCRHLWRC